MLESGKTYRDAAAGIMGFKANICIGSQFDQPQHFLIL